MIDINTLTIGQIKEINTFLNNKDTIENCPWEIGQSYFIRTVTMYLTGKLIQVTQKELILSDAAWIADTGRFSDALKTGKLNEVEPFIDDVIINRDSIIDATFWRHPLPNEEK